MSSKPPGQRAPFNAPPSAAACQMPSRADA